MADKTITSFFDNYDDAADAVRRLESAGIPRSDISLIANNEGERYSSHAKRTWDENSRFDDDDHDGAATGATVGTLAGGGAGLLAGLGMLAIPGFGPVVAAGWLVPTLIGAGAGAAIGGLAGSLVDVGVDENDAHAYAEGVRRGGALVTVRSSEENVTRIVGILDDEGTVDFEERQSTWRSEGWTGGTSAGIPAAGVMSGRDALAGRSAMAASDAETGPDFAAGSAATRSAGVSTSGRDSLAGATGRDEVIPVVEEELHVGKRDVSGGRVRIHSHMVERPVQEQVNLREERVHVERRPVDRPLSDADAAFRDRTIEAEERRQEAVVSKEARVKEELVVRKDVDQRTETISDTVRSTEVDVEDERRNGLNRSGTTDRR
ncbi:YsnF/AvaK domain-containing protein [Microvirga subterranea]|uniref:Uncharacterized protein (TIGR02271 family) n=1 Tax=Microvirga subterranea TaxID=186651 RepID=A0A370HN60_9HYPH|nr:YsnF/AvaK domain-containing protein [Microvirga subterranea]RDI57949.1 uncharacterized protein (TIGR02271 family) [Microvirga subterranea]